MLSDTTERIAWQRVLAMVLVLFSLDSLGMFAPVAAPISKVTPSEESKPKRLKFVNNYSKGGDEVQILDEKGQVKKRFDTKGTSSEKRVYEKIVGSESHFIHNRRTVNRTEKRWKARNGNPISETNAFALYDENGNKMFEKKDSPHEPLLINAESEKVVCVLKSPVYEDIPSGSRGELVIYDFKGNQIYFKEQDDVRDLALSPNGRWMVFNSSVGESSLRVIDLMTDKTYFAPDSYDVSSFSEIDNSGNLYMGYVEMQMDPATSSKTRVFKKKIVFRVPANK